MDLTTRLPSFTGEEQEKDKSFDSLQGYIEENYSESLTQEDIIGDPRLMEPVYNFLEARKGGKGPMGTVSARKAATFVGGGSTLGTEGHVNFRELKAEDAWELFQSHQRSFAGGQSVTTMNEAAYAGNSDWETKRALGEGYFLFDQMDNVFTGDGTWSDMAQAVGQYSKAAVWDPTTVLSLGVGKLISSGGTKAASATLKKGVQTAVKKGVEKKALGSSLLRSTTAAGSVLASEAAMEAAKDVVYQRTLVDTGAQEEYIGSQTAVAAAGAILVPLAIGGAGRVAGGARKALRKKGVDLQATESLDLAKNISLTSEEAFEKVEARTDKELIGSVMDESFGKIEIDPSSSTAWAKRTDGTPLFDVGTMTDLEYETSFMKRFWFGDKAGGKGYYEALNEAGFVMHPAMLKDGKKVTEIFADIIEYLDDTVVENMMTSFEKANGGRSLPIVDRTPKGLADTWSNSVSKAGSDLWVSSKLSRWARNGVDPSEALKQELQESKVPSPLIGKYALSGYKRMLTASISTTGANLKGFAMTSSLDTVSELVGAVYYKGLQAGATGLDLMSPSAGYGEVASQYGRQAYGSYTGAMKKGFSVFSPEMSYKYADKVLTELPKVEDKLFSQISGDAGDIDPLGLYNLEGSKIASATEKVISAAQAASLVKVQDEVTKKVYFASALDKGISETYGISPFKFWSQEDAAIEMHSPRFASMLEKAVFETQSVTASITYRDLPQAGLTREVAKGIESVSKMPAFGYIMPFGSFMNTTMMYAGDYSGINAIRNLTRLGSTGTDLDYASKDGVQLLARATVGWAAVATLVPEAYEKIDQGLSYNQEVREDGSINDSQFDWPISTIKLVSHIVAHATRDDPREFNPEAIPESLLEELSKVVTEPEYAKARTELLENTVGTGFKDMVDAFDGILKTFTRLNEQGWNGKDDVWELIGPVVGRVASGYSRPVEGLNAMTGLAKGANMNPDRRQGNKFLNQALRYVDHLTGYSEGTPVRADPGQGLLTTDKTDVGRHALGVRSNPAPGVWSRMLSSADMDPYRSLSKHWTGSAEVRNAADALAHPILEKYAEQALKAHPNFTELDLKDKQDIMNRMVNTPARKEVSEMITDGIAGESLKHLRTLGSKNKLKVAKVMEAIGLEDSRPEDFLTEPNGEETLRRILYLMDNYDDLFDTENIVRD